MSKTLKHSIKSNLILDKGIELLWSKGYNATSVNDIVKAAEIPKGSFYFYFDNKESFAVKALEKYFDQQLPKILEVLKNKPVSPKKRLLEFYTFRITMLKEELNCKMGCMASNMANEIAEHHDTIRTVIESKGKFIKGEITKVVEEAQAIGEIDISINARDLVEFIEDAGKGAMTTMKEMKSDYPINNFLNMIKNLLLK